MCPQRNSQYGGDCGDAISRCPHQGGGGGLSPAGIPIPSLLPESQDEIKATATELLTYPIEIVYTATAPG